ncbi:MAG: hypothetical protein GF392_01030 [Candidatus Omnitrophica bacterium]|nr:hypothetical protein [Candidatus Omnitrophota bacterium]
MFVKILGVLWCAVGIFWLSRPESLRRWVRKRTGRRFRRMAIVAILVAGLTLVGAVFRVPGVPAKIIMLAGLIMTIRAIQLITTRTSERVYNWFDGRSVRFFRIWALCVTGLGVLMIFA